MNYTSRMRPQPVQLWQADAATPPAPEPVVQPAAEAPKEEDMGFDAAFAELTAPEDQVVIDAKDGGTTEELIEGALPDPKTVGVKAGDTPAAPAAPAAPAPAAPAAQATPEPTPAAPPAANEDDKVLAAWARAQLLEQAKAKPATPDPAAAAPATPEPLTPYTTEEQALIDNYQKEWPDVAVAEQLVRRQEYQALTRYMFDQLRPVLTELVTHARGTTQTMHTSELHQAVPDYDDIRDKVVAWAGDKSHPAYLKSAYENVVKNGSTEEVVDLINRWRTASGTAAPAASATPLVAAPAAQAGTPAPAPKGAPAVAPKKVLAGLTPVKSKTSGVQTGAIALDDFDGAFAAFSKSMPGINASR